MSMENLPLMDDLPLRAPLAWDFPASHVWLPKGISRHILTIMGNLPLGVGMEIQNDPKVQAWLEFLEDWHWLSTSRKLSINSLAFYLDYLDWIFFRVRGEGPNPLGNRLNTQNGCAESMRFCFLQGRSSRRQFKKWKCGKLLPNDKGQQKALLSSQVEVPELSLTSFIQWKLKTCWDFSLFTSEWNDNGCLLNLHSGNLT